MADPVPWSERLENALSFRQPSALRDLAGKLRLDSWYNVVTGLGGRRDSSTLAVVGAPHYLTDQDILNLFHGSDLARKIVSKLPTEAMRRKWESGTEALDKALDKWNAYDLFLEGWIWGRAYGRGGLYLGMSDALGAQDTPLYERRIKSGDLLYVMPVEGIDLRIAETDRDRKSLNFGEPTHYQITSVSGQVLPQKIHASRFILFGGALTSERISITRDGADLSVLQAVAEILRDTEQSWRGVMLLLQDLSQAVFKIKGLVSMIANGQKDLVLQRMEIVDLARSIARAVVVDADGEGFEHVGAANVTGVGPLLDQVCQRLAGAADMPLTVLFGTSPAGMNATGESDLRMWYSTAEAGRVDVTPQATRLTRIVAKATGIEDWQGTIKWPSLWQPSATELAELDSKRTVSAASRIQSQISSADEERTLWLTGVLPANEVLNPIEEDTPPETALQVVAGSMWLDTEDGHRLEVTAVADGSVYFVDLDSPNPTRQWRWRVSSFLERSRPAPPMDNAPAPAPEA